MEPFLEVIRDTLALAVRFLPVLVATMAASVLLRSWSIADAARRLLDRRRGTAALLGAGIGAFSPLCSCTVVPVVRGLLKARVPLGGVVAFWIASPLMDPEIFLLTVAVLGLPLAVARLAATGVLSVGAGLVADRLDRRGWFGPRLLRGDPGLPCASPEVSCSDPDPATGTATRPAMHLGTQVGTRRVEALAGAATVAPTDGRVASAVSRRLDPRAFIREVIRETWVIGRWLLVAFLLQVLIVRYVPESAMTGVLGGDTPLAIPLAAVLGVPLYLTNVAALPIVAGLLEQGMAPGAAITFLVAGPVTTVPAMAAVRGTVNGRVFAYYLGVGVLGAMAVGAVVSLVLPRI